MDDEVDVVYPVGARLLRRSHGNTVPISPTTPWTFDVMASPRTWTPTSPSTSAP